MFFGNQVESLLSLALYLLLVLIVVSLLVMVNKLRGRFLISAGHSTLGIVIETSPEAAIISWIMAIDEDKKPESDETEKVVDNTDVDSAI